jgi:hypothetical protein
MVSGCLVASNNPSALRAVLGDDFDDNDRLDPSNRTRLAKALLQWFLFVFPKTLQSAWIWNRGREKHKWVVRIPAFVDRITIVWWEYSLIGLAAILLILIPSLLGLIVAYHMPQIGLGCRSVAILIYTCTQIDLVIYFVSKSQNISYLPAERSKRKWENIWQCTLGDALHQLWQLFFGLAAGTAIFAGVAGTLLEIMGVYCSCLCLASFDSWLNPNTPIKLHADPAQVRDKSQL